MIALNTAACGCTVPPAAAPPAQQSSNSILISSTPAAGSTVRSPIAGLDLNFNPPARLDEVTVTGPDGVMPMMVHPIGEVADYSLPLSELGPGSYVVNWRATAQGREYRGTFQFIVRR